MFYLPSDLVSKVKEWNRTYRQLKKLIREVSRNSLALIHRHVANQAGRKPKPGMDAPLTAQAPVWVVFPSLNDWLNRLPDPRIQELCLYAAAHLWWQIIATCLSRQGSRNGFDQQRQSGEAAWTGNTS